MPWSLILDLLSARILVWFASVGREASLTPEAHAYFADRYRRLAEYYKARGRVEEARRYRELAAKHGRETGDDSPPSAAAMALPRPRRFVTTDAYSRVKLDGPDDVA